MANSNIIGNVGGITKTITVTPTVTTANAYGTNFVVGGLLTFSNAMNAGSGTGILQSVTVTVKDVETMGFTFFPFVVQPTNTTWTDAAAAAINAADVGKVIAPVPLSSNTQLAASLFSVSYNYGLGLPLQVPIATPSNVGFPGNETFTTTTPLPIWGVLLTNAALTNNFAGASDLTVSITILQDG